MVPMLGIQAPSVFSESFAMGKPTSQEEQHIEAMR